MKKIICLLLIAVFLTMPMMAEEPIIEAPKKELKDDKIFVVWMFIGGLVASLIAKDVIVDQAYGVKK